MVDDFRKASDFRHETANYIRECLLQEQRSQASTSHLNLIITSFGPVGDALSRHYNTRKQISRDVLKRLRLECFLNDYRSSWTSFGRIVIFYKDVRTRTKSQDITWSPHSGRLHESSHGLKRGRGLPCYYGVRFYKYIFLLWIPSLTTPGMPMKFHCLR